MRAPLLTFLARSLLALLAPTLFAAPTIPALVQNSIRQRVDYRYNPAIVVGIANSTGRAFYSYGMADLAAERPANEQTLFEIGSVTKAFTATLLAQMSAAGEVTLTHPVQNYLPNTVTVPSRGGIQITLQHLATHASGLPYIPPNLPYSAADNPFADYDLALLYAFLNTYTLPRNPGATYEYSNVGVGLLGHALALRAGASYENLLRARILDPLGLNNIRITLSNDQLARRATGYGGIVPRPPFEAASLEAAGEIQASADDLLAFMEYNSGLRASSLAAVFANAASTRRATDLPGINIGLGWWLYPIANDTIVFHGGNTMGQTAFAAYRKNPATAVIILTNARVNQYANVDDLGFYLLGVIPSLNPIAQPAAVPLATLRRDHGLYTALDGSFFEIRQTNDFLTLAYFNAPNFFMTLYPETATRFNVLDPGVNGSSTFQTDPSGQVTAMTWTQNGATTTYQRQTAAAQLAIHNPAELILHGDSQKLYEIQVTENFQDWLPISTNSIWTNRITLPTPPPTHQFYRARVATGL